MGDPLDWKVTNLKEPKTVYEFLEQIIKFRGRLFFTLEAIKNWLPKLDSNGSAVALKIRAVKTFSGFSHAFLECTIGDDRYITYKTPRNKNWDEEILDEYLYEVKKEKPNLKKIADGQLKKKEEVLGIQAVTLLQLSKIIEKTLTEQNLQGDLKFIYEEFLLQNI